MCWYPACVHTSLRAPAATRCLTAGDYSPKCMYLTTCACARMDSTCLFCLRMSQRVLLLWIALHYIRTHSATSQCQQNVLLRSIGKHTCNRGSCGDRGTMKLGGGWGNLHLLARWLSCLQSHSQYRTVACLSWLRPTLMATVWNVDVHMQIL